MTGRDRHRPEVLLAATIACVVGLGGAFVIWGAGLGQYLEDYCFTRIDPKGMTSAGPFFAGPTRVGCTFNGSRDVVVTDWRPLLWTLTWIAGAILGALVVRAAVRAALRS